MDKMDRGGGAFLTQGKAFSIPTIFSWGSSISPDGFLLSILLLLVIIVAFVIVVTVVLVVVVGEVMVMASSKVEALRAAGTNEAGNKPSGVPKDSSDTPLRDNENTKSVYAKVEGQVKGSDKGSILEQFRKSREDSSSKSISDSDDSEVEEVCMPYGISGGGLLDVLEDDLDCFDLTEQEQAFCDRYDICLNSRCRK
ncbi:hypothetical protein Tco_0787677 [Tanacetum coccineum]